MKQSSHYNQLSQNVLHETIARYLTSLTNDEFHRYKSWDHCYNAFSTKSDIELLALHLGFYLASWGMYRGSGGLLQKNHRIHLGAIKILQSRNYYQLQCNPTNEVKEKDVLQIISLKGDLSLYYNGIMHKKGNNLEKPISPTDTLISKIILGTLACVPAYDRYFLMGMKHYGIKHRLFNEGSLLVLFAFIEQNQPALTKSQHEIHKQTGNHYPFMKLLDMFFWQTGYEMEINNYQNRN